MIFKQSTISLLLLGSSVAETAIVQRGLQDGGLLGCLSAGDPSACCAPPADGSALDGLASFFCTAMQCVNFTSIQIYATADESVCNCNNLNGACGGAYSQLGLLGMDGLCMAINGCCSSNATTNADFNGCIAMVDESGELDSIKAMGDMVAGMGLGGGDSAGAGAIAGAIGDAIPTLINEGGDTTTAATETPGDTNNTTAEKTETPDDTTDGANDKATDGSDPAAATETSSGDAMRSVVSASWAAIVLASVFW